MLESTITLVGNLVEDPHLRPVGTGTYLATFRMACTERRFDRAQEKWVNGSSLFLRVACWRQLAANVCMSIRRGDRVLVVGRVRQRSYETKEGQRRVAYEVEAEAVGVELTWRAVDVRRPKRPSTDAANVDSGESGAEGDGFTDVDPVTGVIAGPAGDPDTDLDSTASSGSALESLDEDLDDADDYNDLDDGREDGAAGATGSGRTSSAALAGTAVPFSDAGVGLGTVTE